MRGRGFYSGYDIILEETVISIYYRVASAEFAGAIITAMYLCTYLVLTLYLHMSSHSEVVSRFQTSKRVGYT